MSNKVCNPYLKSSTATLPTAHSSPPTRHSLISLLSPDDVGLGTILIAVASVDLDADDRILSGVKGMTNISLAMEPDGFTR